MLEGAPEKTVAAIALGSNISSRFGTPSDNLHEAVRRMSALGRVCAVSSFRSTAPVGFTAQPDFTNAAALLETSLGPEPLLQAMLAIEAAMGRIRVDAPSKGPRIIDLDLLLYGSSIVMSSALHLPHPAMAERAFVLEPLAEIAPGLIHPVLNRTIAELLLQQAARAGG
jgi:2-amino-4-hydroxy-6-hydroxymethyldihydropteridine diphosphokinase